MKIIRKYIILSLTLFFGAAIKSMACGFMPDTHDADVFNIYRQTQSDDRQKKLSAFWEAYYGKLSTEQQEVTKAYPYLCDYFFANDCELLFQAASKKKDKEMLTYLEQTTQYSSICEQIQDVWEYPSKEQLEARKAALNKMRGIAKAYKGTRMKAQYSLLYMRANMLLKQYATNEQYWNKVGKTLPESVFKNMMESLYANAILNQGKWREACDIYAKQGDWESVEWTMKNYRNAAGIQTIYKEDPNSPALNYLVQYYINGGYGWDWANERPVNKNDENVKQFIHFINSDVMNNPEVKDKSLWKAASAMLHFYSGDYKTADKEIKMAASLQGSEQTKECVRCIALVISTRIKKYNAGYAKYLRNEFEWLQSKAQQKYEDYFYNMLDRMVFLELNPKLIKAGKKNEATALLAMMDGIKIGKEDYSDPNSSPEKRGYLTYTWEYSQRLDSMTAKELDSYYRYLQSKPKDQLQQFAISHADIFPQAFIELIGTKYLAEGNFAKAITYLEQVPLSYINNQDISIYAWKRSFDKDRWFERQRMTEEDFAMAPEQYRLKNNEKLDFCRDMLNIESQYKLAATPEIAADKAYELASRYLQASCYGDCWYLTHYEQHWFDSARTWEKDFAQEALKYLGISKVSNRKDMQLKSLFATAYIQFNVNAIQLYWHNSNPDSWFGDMPQSGTLYEAYNDLAAFVRKNNSQEDYISRCDILREFMNR